MRGRFALGLACASLSLAAVAADPASAWLTRMSDAARVTNYQGVIVYQTRDRLETLRVIHRYADGNEVERVQALTGDPREILKQGNQVICLLPKDRKVTLQLPTPKGLFPAMTTERVTQLQKYYDFKDAGTARIAGRTCRGITIAPRDQFRYGYEIWADSKTAVPVKVNLLGADRTVVEQLMFTQIEFPESIPDSAFRTELDPAKFRRVTRIVRDAPPPLASEAEAAGDMRFAQLPPGYRVAMREVRRSPDGQGLVEHLVLSDGLSAISVFAAQRKTPPLAGAEGSGQGASQIGAVHAYRRIVGTLHVTVVGEAPSAAVRLVGDGAQPLAATPVDDSPSKPSGRP